MPKNNSFSPISESIPVNVVTGYLGCGKTTIIMNLLKQLDHPEKVVWLKNEYGDQNIDKLLLKETNVIPSEILNGCLCCVLVGKLELALKEILEKYKPERIIIETSGSAWPGPIVWEINRIKGIYVDSVLTVVDCLNFTGYKDKSYAAKMQVKFVDLVIFNKYPENLVPASQSEIDLEQKLDDVYAVFPTTPKIKTKDGWVKEELLIGLDSHTLSQIAPNKDPDHNLEHEDEVEVFEITIPTKNTLTKDKVKMILDWAGTRSFIRIKGVVTFEDHSEIINWVYGRASWHELANYTGENIIVFMGKNILSYKEVINQKLLAE